MTRHPPFSSVISCPCEPSICCHGIMRKLKTKGKASRLAICLLTNYFILMIFIFIFLWFASPFLCVHRHLCNFLKMWSDIFLMMDLRFEKYCIFKAMGSKCNYCIIVQQINECIFCLLLTMKPWWCVCLTQDWRRREAEKVLINKSERECVRACVCVVFVCVLLFLSPISVWLCTVVSL